MHIAQHQFFPVLATTSTDLHWLPIDRVLPEHMDRPPDGPSTTHMFSNPLPHSTEPTRAPPNNTQLTALRYETLLAHTLVMTPVSFDPLLIRPASAIPQPSLDTVSLQHLLLTQVLPEQLDRPPDTFHALQPIHLLHTPDVIPTSDAAHGGTHDLRPP